MDTTDPATRDVTYEVEPSTKRQCTEVHLEALVDVPDANAHATIDECVTTMMQARTALRLALHDQKFDPVDVVAVVEHVRQNSEHFRERQCAKGDFARSLLALRAKDQTKDQTKALGLRCPECQNPHSPIRTNCSRCHAYVGTLVSCDEEEEEDADDKEVKEANEMAEPKEPKEDQEEVPRKDFAALAKKLRSAKGGQFYNHVSKLILSAGDYSDVPFLNELTEEESVNLPTPASVDEAVSFTMRNAIEPFKAGKRRRANVGEMVNTNYAKHKAFWDDKSKTAYITKAMVIVMMVDALLPEAINDANERALAAHENAERFEFGEGDRRIEVWDNRVEALEALADQDNWSEALKYCKAHDFDGFGLPCCEILEELDGDLTM